MESTSRQVYQTQHGHKLTTVRSGLKISMENSWLAASPDDQVHDEASSPNPFSKAIEQT
jgi:hypothetical protein